MGALTQSLMNNGSLDGHIALMLMMNLHQRDERNEANLVKVGEGLEHLKKHSDSQFTALRTMVQESNNDVAAKFDEIKKLLTAPTPTTNSGGVAAPTAPPPETNHSSPSSYSTFAAALREERQRTADCSVTLMGPWWALANTLSKHYNITTPPATLPELGFASKADHDVAAATALYLLAPGVRRALSPAVGDTAVATLREWVRIRPTRSPFATVITFTDPTMKARCFTHSVDLTSMEVEVESRHGESTSRDRARVRVVHTLSRDQLGTRRDRHAPRPGTGPCPPTQPSADPDWHNAHPAKHPNPFSDPHGTPPVGTTPPPQVPDQSPSQPPPNAPPPTAPKPPPPETCAGPSTRDPLPTPQQNTPHPPAEVHTLPPRTGTAPRERAPDNPPLLPHQPLGHTTGQEATPTTGAKRKPASSPVVSPDTPPEGPDPVPMDMSPRGGLSFGSPLKPMLTLDRPVDTLQAPKPTGPPTEDLDPPTADLVPETSPPMQRMTRNAPSRPTDGPASTSLQPPTPAHTTAGRGDQV